MASHSIVVPVHTSRIDPRKALLAAAVCWTGFAVMVWAVHGGHTETIDKTGLLIWRGPDLHPRGPTKLLESVRDLTALGGTLLRNLFALAAVVALLFLRLRRQAMLLAMTVILAWLVNSAIKDLVGRARPGIVPHLMDVGGNSFPSGHSFNAAAVYISVALAFAAISHRETVRVTIVATSVVISLTIAWSRVWLGVHWPSDVIAGWLGGAGWALTASALLYRPAKAAAQVIDEQSSPEHPTAPSPRR